MEFRAQDNEMRTPGGSLNYIHLTTKESSGERRRVGIHNGSSTTSGLTCTQTLDYPHHVVQPPPPLHVRDPETDRVTTGTGGGGPKLKSPSSAGTIRYRECLKNHAASIGGNVFDGCGEFMPCGEEGTLEALKCAACDCHRNFHRKEIDGESQYSPGSRRSLMLTPLQLPPPLPSSSSAGLGHHHHHHHHQHQKFSIGYHGNHPTASIVQPMNVAYGSAGGTESSSEDLNMFHSTAEAPVAPPPFALSKKRFRTKFTQEQKDRMLEFAEKIDWRIQKQDEEEVEKFCAEVGVKRQVLKVWMHNNKSTIKKQQQQESSNQSLEMIEADQPEAEAEAEAEPEGVDN